MSKGAPNIAGSVPNDSIARLVRATLEADAVNVDTVRMQSEICEKLAEHGNALAHEAAPPTLSGRFARRMAVRASLIAASLLIVAGLAGYLFVSTSPVQAYALVRSAQLALDRPADREYRVSLEHADNLPFLNSIDEARLWTRGDRYRVMFRRGDKTIQWGQDDQRRLWVAGSPDKGLSFEAREVPREVTAVLSYLSLDLRRLTDQILHNCDLSFTEGMRQQRAGVKTVQAIVKPNGNRVEFSTAEMDIDETNKTIRRLELTRRVNGKERGRCLFVLVDDQPQPDESYQLSTHLADGAKVLDKRKYHDRMVELFRIIREFTTSTN